MIFKNKLLKDNGIIFITISIANLCNLFFHLFMIRKLTIAEYGILNALIGLYLILTQPSEIFEMVITKLTSFYYSINQNRKLKQILLSISIKIGLVSGVFLLLLLIFTPFITQFFKINSQVLIILLVFITFLSFLSSIIIGIFRGFQKFIYFGLFLFLNSFLKLGFCIFLVLVGLKVVGVLSGWLSAQVFSFMIGFLILFYIFGKGTYPKFLDIKKLFLKYLTPSKKGKFRKIYKYFVFVACNNLLFAAITNIDLILVKHYFDFVTTGYYSIAQMVGKIILFLPASISIVMFPKISFVHARDGKGVNIFKRSLLYVTLLCLIAIVFCIVFPEEIIRLISGHFIPECLPLVKLFSISMGFFALCFLIFIYNLSMNEFKYLYLVLFFFLTEVSFIILFHESLLQILKIVVIISISLFISSSLFTYYNIRKAKG